MEAYQDLYRYIYGLLFPGEEMPATIDAPVINWALMFELRSVTEGKSSSSSRRYDARRRPPYRLRVLSWLI
jgi:hypothetical protein